MSEDRLNTKRPSFARYSRVIVSEEEVILCHLFLYIRWHAQKWEVLAGQFPAQCTESNNGHTLHLQAVLQIREPRVTNDVR